jgi:hypothetical protein
LNVLLAKVLRAARSQRYRMQELDAQLWQDEEFDDVEQADEAANE